MSVSFPERLRAARESKGLSQTDLAKRAGFQPSAICHFENGRRTPSLDSLRKLADALSVSLDYLAGRSEQKGSAGPRVRQLLRDFSKLSARDQENVVDFTRMLARKKKSNS